MRKQNIWLMRLSKKSVNGLSIEHDQYEDNDSQSTIFAVPSTLSLSTFGTFI